MAGAYIHKLILIAAIIVVAIGLSYWVLNAQCVVLVIPKYSEWPNEVRETARILATSPPADRQNQISTIYDYLNVSYNKQVVCYSDVLFRRVHVTTPGAIKSIMGDPDIIKDGCYYYSMINEAGHRRSLVFEFQRGVLISYKMFYEGQ